MTERTEQRMTIADKVTRAAIAETHAVIRSFMVHHQGMILLSLCNYLREDRMIRRFQADPRVQSVELLLQEQTPAHAPTESHSPPSTSAPLAVPNGAFSMWLASWLVRPTVSVLRNT